MIFLKKPVLLIIVLLFSSLAVFAKPVSQNTAKQAALNFLANEASFYPVNPLTLVSSTTLGSGYYIFSNDKCFVIISADDAGDPILAYSTESGFNTTNVSPSVAYMLQNYSKQIRYIVKNQVPATGSISTRWNNLINNTLPQYKNPAYISPLTKTTWDQAPYYNDMCPFDSAYSERTVTGCVATAMAQVMRFWKYPSTGVGSNSYTDNNYGTLSVNFGADAYDWANMPNKLNTANTSVALLMYDCGVAVDMNYGVATTGGSGANVIPYGNGGPRGGNNQKCAENALIYNFGYDADSIQGITRNDSTDAEWINMLETELAKKRPIIYSGFDSLGEGHCFVFDGYNSTHTLFHVNWGWSGVYNGYFNINKLNPGAGNIGAGIGSFNFGQQAIIGIMPPLTAASGIASAAGNFAGSLNIYPNPAQNNINADLSGIIGQTKQIDFINLQGKHIYSIVPSVDNNKISINTSDLPSGVYVMQVISDKGVANARVIIAR